MSESSGLIVHCPSCGDALMAMPQVSSCNVSHDELRITLNPWHVTHICRPR